MELLTRIKNQILDHERNEERHEKESFWATDTEKDRFEIYHRWIGTEPTNPISVDTLLTFNAGGLMEEAIVKRIEDLGILKETQTRVEMKRYGVPITGYIDAVLEDGTPVEIKSYYGDYQERELSQGQARTSYCKQLAVYMDFLQTEKGI